MMAAGHGRRLRRARKHGHPDDAAARRGRIPGARVRHLGRGGAELRGHRVVGRGRRGHGRRRARRGRRRRGRRDLDAARLGHRRARAARPPGQRAGPARARAAGCSPACPPGPTVIDMSSSDPARTQALAPLLAAAGVTLIDAPVSGGVAGARAGTLAVMAGGPAAAFDRFKPMLGAIGSRVVHAGDTGAGHAVKALNNLMSAAQPAGGVRGADRGPAVRARPGGDARDHQRRKRALHRHGEQVAELRADRRSTTRGSAIRLMVKDIRLALGIEHATGDARGGVRGRGGRVGGGPRRPVAGRRPHRHRPLAQRAQ